MIIIADKVKHLLVFAIKILIVLGAFYFIYNQLVHNPKLDWQKIQKLVFQKATFLGVITMFFLSFVNRFLEIIKWQNLVSTFKSISLAEATKQVLSALTAGLFTPNGLGEYAGKAFYFKATETKKVIFLNLVCNGIQMIITIFFGTIGLFILGYTKIGGLILFLVGILCVVLYFVKDIKFKKYSLKNIYTEWHRIPKIIHTKNLFLALGRYITFSHQYYLLFIAFDVQVPYITLMASIASVYFLASSLPSFQFLDFAVKGSIAVYFLQQLGVQEWIAVWVTTLLWLLNTAIPVGIGSFYVMQFKINKNL